MDTPDTVADTPSPPISVDVTKAGSTPAPSALSKRSTVRRAVEHCGPWGAWPKSWPHQNRSLALVLEMTVAMEVRESYAAPWTSSSPEEPPTAELASAHSIFPVMSKAATTGSCVDGWFSGRARSGLANGGVM